MLRSAINNVNIPMVEFLIEEGTDLTVKDDHDNDILTFARNCFKDSQQKAMTFI